MRHPTLRVKNAYLAMRRGIEETVQRFGLTAAQFDVLQQLLHEDGLEHRELLRRLSLASPTLSVLLDALEARGLVRRTAGDVDGRVKRLWLEPEARDLCRSDAFQAAGRQTLERMFAGFSADEREVLLSLLDRLEKNFSPP